MRRVLIACGLIALGARLPSPAEAQAPSFAGTWKLNEKESDDPAEQFSRAMQREAEPVAAEGFGKDRRRGPPPVRGTSTASTPAGETSGAGRGPCTMMALLRQPLKELVIEQTDSTITLRGGPCPPGTFYLDGRTTTESLPAGGVMTSAHSFKDGKLKVERKAGESMQARETYSIHDKRFTIELLVNTPQMPNPLRMKLVYDREG